MQLDINIYNLFIVSDGFHLQNIVEFIFSLIGINYI